MRRSIWSFNIPLDIWTFAGWFVQIPSRGPKLCSKSLPECRIWLFLFLRKRRNRDRGFLVDLFFRVNCSRKWTVCFRYPHIKDRTCIPPGRRNSCDSNFPPQPGKVQIPSQWDTKHGQMPVGFPVWGRKGGVEASNRSTHIVLKPLFKRQLSL